MPTKILSSPADRNGLQDTFKFGGGANTVIALDPAVDPGFGYIIGGGGGNDTLFGSGLDDDLTGGDGDDTIFGGAGMDTINGGEADGSDASKGKNPPPSNFLVGDGTRLGDGTYSTDLFGGSGGASNDIINGGDGGSTNRIYGDYSFISVAAAATYTGGADTIAGGDSDGADIADNDVFGDGETVSLGAGSTFNGGVDTVTGGTGAQNSIWGDVFQVSFSSGATFNGGNDVLTGGSGASGFNILYGDAQGVQFTNAAGADGESFVGGMDVLTGGDGVSNQLFGDTVSISNDGDFTGGDDTLTGGSNGATNVLIGDASSGGNVGNVTGGNDVLISGTNANDTMTGDFLLGFAVGLPPLPGDPPFVQIGGADRFEFASGNGQDRITDFEAGKDTIDLIATGITLGMLDRDTDGGSSVADGFIDAADDFATLSGGDLVIDLGAAAGGAANTNLLTIEGATQVAASDFDFFIPLA